PTPPRPGRSLSTWWARRRAPDVRHGNLTPRRAAPGPHAGHGPGLHAGRRRLARRGARPGRHRCPPRHHAPGRVREPRGPRPGSASAPRRHPGRPRRRLLPRPQERRPTRATRPHRRPPVGACRGRREHDRSGRSALAGHADHRPGLGPRPSAEGGEVSGQRAAGYCRVSTEEQAEQGFSLGEQERTLREDAEHRGETWTRAYVDAGLSGRSKERRPQLNAMLAAAEAGEFDVLVIPALDRLARNARDAHDIFARLERANVAIRSLRGEVDTSTSTGRLMTGVMASLAEFESNVIGERTRSGKAAAARAGRPNGGPRRFGFDQRDGQLIPRRGEIAVVERILREAVAGRSQAEIAAGLNADGHLTARGKRWNQPQISQLVADPIWIGVLKNKEGEHRIAEPYLPVELWEAAQRTLRGPDGPRAGRQSQRFLLGNGMLRCGRCGSSMQVRRERKGYGFYEVYICYGRSSGAHPDCTQSAVHRAAVDGAVLAYFERVGLDVEATRRELAERSDRERAELRTLRGQAERELAKVQAGLEKVERDYTLGDLPAADYTRLRANLDEALRASGDALERLTAREREVADPG